MDIKEDIIIDPKAADANKTVGQEDIKSATDTKADIKTSGFDSSTISDEDFNQLFSDKRLFTHPRFKSLSERAAKADELEKTLSEAETKTLEEQKKFEELYEKEKTEKSELQVKLRTQMVNAVVQAEANKKGVIDLDVVTKLIDVNVLKVNEDGSIDGVAEAIDKLLTDKPYLVGDVSKTVGSASNPSPNATSVNTKSFKLSQINDSKFYQENTSEILDAWQKGLIVDDTK